MHLPQGSAQILVYLNELFSMDKDDARRYYRLTSYEWESPELLDGNFENGVVTDYFHFQFTDYVRHAASREFLDLPRMKFDDFYDSDREPKCRKKVKSTENTQTDATQLVRFRKKLRKKKEVVKNDDDDDVYSCACFDCNYELYQNSEQYRTNNDLYEDIEAAEYRPSMKRFFTFLKTCREKSEAWDIDQAKKSYQPIHNHWGNL